MENGVQNDTEIYCKSTQKHYQHQKYGKVPANFQTLVYLWSDTVFSTA